MLSAAVAVYPRKFTNGLEAPQGALTFDWRKLPGTVENTERIVATGRVLTLEEALQTRWTTDAHLAPYVLHGPDGVALDLQPRVNKSALPWLIEQGFGVRASILAADLDNKLSDGRKTPWTPQATEEALEQAQRIEALKTGVWYFTVHGRRLIHVLDAWVDARAYEGVLRAWHLELRAQGLDPDPTCKEWNRLYGCPWLKRADGKKQEQTPWTDGLALRSPPGDPSAFDLPAARKARGSVSFERFEETLPAVWVDRAAQLAQAIGSVETEWHSLFLALSGALVQRRVPLSLLPGIVGAASARTERDTKQHDRMEGARTTIRRFLAGEPIAGFDQLLVRWPSVAAAVDRVVAEPVPTPPSQVLPSSADVARRIEETLGSLRDGVTGLCVTCGAGKTYGAERFAASRALRGRSAAGRAKPGAKVSISEPTNEMAKQVAANLRAQGTVVLRVFSPASELDRNGQPVCHFKEAADALASGRLSVPWELCEGRGQDPCPYRSTCPAAEGQEGDPEALVMVGNHSLLPVLVAHAGITGVRVIDEPPAALLTHALTDLDLAALRQYAHCFDPEFYVAVRDAAAIASFLFDELKETLDISDAFPHEVLEAVRSLQIANGPPLRWMHVRRAREQVALAQDLGRASRAASILCEALRSDARWTVRVETRGGVPTLLFSGPNEDLVHALRAEGSTALLDASLDERGLSAAAGYDLAPRVVQLQARDGAPIVRTHLFWGAGSRKALVEGGDLQVRRFATGLRAALAWASEDASCTRIGLFTILPFRLLLDCVLAPGEETEKRWRRRGLPFAVVQEAREVLPPILALFAGEIRVGHYGRTRGLNSWRDCEATISIADPWPNLGDVRNDALYLGLNEDGGRAEFAARAELEQAHGRLRAPQRTTPGRMLHVGRLLPLGVGWDSAELRRMPEGRPVNDAAMTAQELRTWIDRNHGASIRKAAKALGCSHQTLCNYLRESRAIPSLLAVRVRGVNETFNRESLIRVSLTAPLTPSEPLSGTSGR